MIIPNDPRIKKNCVLATERGLLFVATGKHARISDGTHRGWHGIGFNGVRIRTDYPEFIAENVNEYINTIINSDDVSSDDTEH